MRVHTTPVTLLIACAMTMPPAHAQQTTVRVPLPPVPKALVSVWYWGLPAGIPRQADLNAIAAAGFTAVTWPLPQVDHVLELRRMADRALLKVVIRSEPEPLTPTSARAGDTQVDVDVRRTSVAMYPSLVWRAVAHGARVVSFDAGVTEGTGLTDDADRPSAWVRQAGAVARQVNGTATLLATVSTGPAVRVDPPAHDLDVVLLEAPRSWVLIATNTAASGTPPVDTYAFMPPGVPPAEWLNLFDGSTIGMSSRPTGARWHVVLGAGDARVYVIDKDPR